MADVKKITISEFRCWLEGVEEMQEETWTPTPTQWKRIRDKINQINNEPVSNFAPTYRGDSRGEMAIPVPGPSVARDVPAFPVAAHGSVLPPPRLPSGSPTLPGEKTKTPDIDTSSGNYQTPFA